MRPGGHFYHLLRDLILKNPIGMLRQYSTVHILIVRDLPCSFAMAKNKMCPACTMKNILREKMIAKDEAVFPFALMSSSSFSLVFFKR